MKFRKIIIGAMLPLALFSCASKEVEKKELPEYPAIAVKVGSATLEATYPIVLRGKEDVEIRPRIDGFIDAIYVDEGSVVKAGQALFKINSPVSQQGYTSAKASVASSQAQVNTAKLNVDRIRPLAEKNIVSEVQLATYENAYETALAGLAQAKAVLQNATETLSWTTVTSPVSGVMGTVPFRKGSLVNSSNILTNVANTSSIYAYFSLNESKVIEFMNTLEGETQAEKIKNAPAVTLTLKDGTVYATKGKLETISGVISEGTGTANLRVSFPNEKGELKSGFSGNISMSSNIDNVFVIPQESTFALQDKRLVYRLEGDSVMQYAVTVVELPGGKDYAVTNGLSEGDVIISKNIATVTSGMKLKPILD